MKKFTFLAAIAIVLTVFNGCQKDELKTPSDDGIAKTGKADVYLENGYLAFKNMNAVDSVINLLSKMSRNEKDLWEQKNGFKSARSEFYSLFDEYEKLTSKDEFLKFKAKNATQLKFNEMDETDCSIDYPYSCSYFNPVMNNKGIFKVGVSLFKYTKEKQIIILDGDMKKLENLDSYSNDKNVIVNTSLKSTQTESDSMLDEFVNDNPYGAPNRWWTKGDRRLNNQLRWLKYLYVLSNDGFNSTISYGFVFYLRQESHKHSVFGWNTYFTTYHLWNVLYKCGSFPNGAPYLPNGGVSPEVKPMYKWDIYREQSVIVWPSSSIDQVFNGITRPLFSLQGYVSCRGFDGVLDDIHYTEHYVFP